MASNEAVIPTDRRRVSSAANTSAEVLSDISLGALNPLDTQDLSSGEFRIYFAKEDRDFNYELTKLADSWHHRGFRLHASNGGLTLVEEWQHPDCRGQYRRGLKIRVAGRDIEAAIVESEQDESGNDTGVDSLEFELSKPVAMANNTRELDDVQLRDRHGWPLTPARTLANLTLWQIRGNALAEVKYIRIRVLRAESPCWNRGAAEKILRKHWVTNRKQSLKQCVEPKMVVGSAKYDETILQQKSQSPEAPVVQHKEVAQAIVEVEQRLEKPSNAKFSTREEFDLRIAAKDAKNAFEKAEIELERAESDCHEAKKSWETAEAKLQVFRDRSIPQEDNKHLLQRLEHLVEQLRMEEADKLYALDMRIAGEMSAGDCN